MDETWCGVTEEEHWHSLARRTERLLEGVAFERELAGGLGWAEEGRAFGAREARGLRVPGTSVSCAKQAVGIDTQPFHTELDSCEKGSRLRFYKYSFRSGECWGSAAPELRGVGDARGHQSRPRQHQRPSHFESKNPGDCLVWEVSEPINQLLLIKFGALKSQYSCHSSSDSSLCCFPVTCLIKMRAYMCKFLEPTSQLVVYGSPKDPSRPQCDVGRGPSLGDVTWPPANGVPCLVGTCLSSEEREAARGTRRPPSLPPRCQPGAQRCRGLQNLRQAGRLVRSQKFKFITANMKPAAPRRGGTDPPPSFTWGLPAPL